MEIPIPTMTAELALRIYSGNIASHQPAAPILAMIDTDNLHATQAPSGIEEYELPDWLGLIEPPGPLRQAVFQCEAEMLRVEDPEGPKVAAAVAYGWGGEENFRAHVAFTRTLNTGMIPFPRFLVDWARPEVLIGEELLKDPVILALRDLVDRSNQP